MKMQETEVETWTKTCCGDDSIVRGAWAHAPVTRTQVAALLEWCEKVDATAVESVAVRALHDGDWMDIAMCAGIIRELERGRLVRRDG